MMQGKAAAVMVVSGLRLTFDFKENILVKLRGFSGKLMFTASYVATFLPYIGRSESALQAVLAYHTSGTR